MQHPAERVEHQAEDLECHHSQQWLRVARVAEDDRRVSLTLRQREVALRDGPADGRAVGEHKLHLALRHEPDGPPHRVGEERVGGPAVDQEANAGFRASRTAHAPLDVADAHAPENGVRGAERRYRKIAERSEDTPVRAAGAKDLLCSYPGNVLHLYDNCSLGDCMAVKTIRLDPRAETLLADVVRRTGMTPSQALRAGLATLHERLRARDDPYAVYERLDLGPGGYARAPARRAKQAVRAILRTKAPR